VSELTARLAIYGSIDRAVVDRRLSVDAVARYIAPYGVLAADTSGDDVRRRPTRGGVATGWYGDLYEMLSGEVEGSTLVAPAALDLSAVMAELAELPLEHPIDAEHRLASLFLARQLLAAVDTFDDAGFVASLQRVVEFDVGAQIDDPSAAASSLADLMAETGRFSDRDGYAEMAATAQSMTLLSTTTAALAATPCDEATAWFRVPGTDDDDVAAVVKSKVTTTVPECSVNDLRLRFHPGRWPACLPSFWGSMDPLAPPPPDAPSPTKDPGGALFVYREHVGDQVNHSEWFSPVLEFWYDEVEGGPAANRVIDGFAIHYGMASALPAGSVQDPRILVDDGELTVRRSNVAKGSMTVTATTYKKLAMRQPLPSAGLAIFACVSGWADQAKALITGCLLNP